jgi:ABC-2 type transport system ATP-binding protein
MTASLEIRDLSHYFGSVRVLEDISLSLQPGVIFGLLGPSGSGKTTLIRLIAGALHPFSGELRAFETALPDRRVASRIGYMTQAAALYPDLSLRENLEFFGTLYGISRSVLTDRIEHVAGTVDLAERLDDQLTTFSGGMIQRSSLAAALLHDPDLILLDEPTVGLDPVLRQSFWRHFRHLADQGRTMIVSSHIMDEADRCDLLGFVREGRLLVTGSPEEIRARAGTSSLEEAFLELARTAEPAREEVRL